MPKNNLNKNNFSLKNKKILITGGAGFIGSATANALIKTGARVVIIDNLSTGKKERLNPKAVFYELNIADSQISKIFKKEKPEVVYHFAFNVLVPKSVENPLMDLDSITGSLRLLINAQKNGTKKFIFASSGFIYGNTQNLPAKETEPIDPISPYVVSKNAVENYIKFFNKSYGLPYVILRYSAVYGPGQTTGAMSDYIQKLKAGKQADIWGNGEKTRDYVYIEDVVRANLMVLNLSNSFKEPIFNVATGKETTLKEVYQTIAKLLSKKSAPNYLPDRPGEQMRYSLDYSKIKSTLNWQPSYDFQTGIKKRLQEEKIT